MDSENYNRKVLCDIAHTAFEVVNRLLSQDQSLASELRSSTTGSRQIYREESITVEMATTLREQFPDHVEITLFTPKEETYTGADWYWRFERGDHAIHARVQAKRVQRTMFGQMDDKGYVDFDITQLNQLLQATTEASRLNGLQAWLATYARFDATPPCGYENLQFCSHHRHESPCARSGPSLWISHAEEIVRQLHNSQRAQVSKIIQNSIRLDCMLPCIGGPETDYGPGKKGFILQSGLKTYQDCIAIIDGDMLLRKQFQGALCIMV